MRVAFLVVLVACGSPLELDWLAVPPPVVDVATPVLVSDQHRLVLAFDPAEPFGTWDGVPLQHVVLTAVPVLVPGPTPLRRYDLRFEVDMCAKEQPVPEIEWWARWPGLCGYRAGDPRPVRVARYHLIVDRQSFRSGGTTLELLDAACIPEDGRGPSCQLHGSIARLSDGTRTVNGNPSW